MNNLFETLAAVSITSLLLFVAVFVFNRISMKKTGLTKRVQNIKMSLAGFFLSFTMSVAAIMIFGLILYFLKVKFAAFSLPICVVLCVAISAVVMKKIGLLDCFSDRTKKCFTKCAVAVIVIIAIECTFFNFSSYSTRAINCYPLDLKSAENGSSVEFSDGGLHIKDKGECFAEFDGLNCNAKNIAIQLKTKADERVIKVNAFVIDKNLSKSYTLVASENIITGKLCYLKVTSTNMTSLKLVFFDAQNITVSSVELNSSQPFSVNYFRFSLLLLVVCLVIIAKSYAWHKLIYNEESVRHRLALVAVVAICLAICVGLFTLSNSQTLMKYKLGDNIYTAPIYQKQFDAFMKGQLNLDISVDKKLVNAGDKAYDPQYRNVNNIQSSWDHAFYNGKYYCYFGAAPIFLFYYPIYLITHCLPSDQFTCTFFGILCVIFATMAVSAIAKTFSKKPNNLLMLFSMFAFPAFGGIYYLQMSGNMYSIPKLCAFAFLFLLIYLTLTAYKKPRVILYLLCGLCVVIIAASRPNIVLCAIALAPYYIGVIANKSIKIGKKAAFIISFLLPVIMGAVAIMIYNYLRFSSPFEFGEKYQLTVNNIALNNISLGFLPIALFQYFLQPITYSNTFPNITPSINSGNFSRFVYSTASYGVLSMPSNWMIALYPAVRKKAKMSLVNRAFIVCSVAVSVVIALIDFSMAGITISYILDIMTIMTLAAFAVMFSAEEGLRQSEYMHKVFYIVCAVLLVVSAFFGFSLILSSEPTNFKTHMPQLFDYIRQAFTI